MQVSTPSKTLPLDLSLGSPKVSPIKSCSIGSSLKTERDMEESRIDFKVEDREEKNIFKTTREVDEKERNSFLRPLDPVYGGIDDPTKTDKDDLPLQKLFQLVQRVSVFFESGSDPYKIDSKTHQSKRQTYQKIPLDVVSSTDPQGLRYTSRRNEKRIRKHHENFPDDSPYRCPYCSKEYEWKSSVRHHIEVVHHKMNEKEENLIDPPQ
ncbi:unnamed protein product [Dimorphilus gyrociliatus]|uniref:C2H2-type domain-containing protein n=1 Tax=Dimorphilus gyrociliatus TaxID=2664684 RepID=A0A7I8VXI2_9ANNE|nr:unnamed protein product [Dimorphilus gyrociliatus]